MLHANEIVPGAPLPMIAVVLVYKAPSFPHLLHSHCHYPTLTLTFGRCVPPSFPTLDFMRPQCVQYSFPPIQLNEPNALCEQLCLVSFPVSQGSQPRPPRDVPAELASANLVIP
jgi:hypothetical protein